MKAIDRQLISLGNDWVVERLYSYLPIIKHRFNQRQIPSMQLAFAGKQLILHVHIVTRLFDGLTFEIGKMQTHSFDV